MAAHIACSPWSYSNRNAGCFVVCAAHGIRQSFGTNHAVAHAACVEHNLLHHPGEGRKRYQLLSIIYESAATPLFQPADLTDLLETARARNRAFGISGLLLAEDGWFLQALEGPAPIVESLMDSIRRDPRHDHVRVLSRETRHDRRFPDWAMAEGHIGEVEAHPLAEYYEALLAARGQIHIPPPRTRSISSRSQQEMQEPEEEHRS